MQFIKANGETDKGMVKVNNIGQMDLYIWDTEEIIWQMARVD